jgi:hypothetical protein
MAQLTLELPEDLMKKLNDLGNSAEYAPKMLKAEQDVVYPEVMRRLKQHHKSGSLENGMKKTEPKLDKNGNWRAQIIPTGTDTTQLKGGGTKKVSNNEKLLSLEYGTSKQVATPVMRPAKESKSAEAAEAAQKVFNEVVSK